MEPVPYPTYFWQTPLIRLRPLRPEDADLKHREGSIAFHRRLGFIEEGRQREVIFMNEHYHDEILYGLTEEEFNRTATGD